MANSADPDSWLQKPTDLDLHCLQRQGISGFSRTRVKTLVPEHSPVRVYILPSKLLYHKRSAYALTSPHMYTSTSLTSVYTFRSASLTGLHICKSTPLTKSNTDQVIIGVSFINKIRTNNRKMFVHSFFKKCVRWFRQQMMKVAQVFICVSSTTLYFLLCFNAWP